NDGRTIVFVPLAEVRKPQVKPGFKPPAPGSVPVGGPDSAPVTLTPGADNSATPPTPAVSAPDALRVLEQALEALREQLRHERDRADRAERRLDELLAQRAKGDSQIVTPAAPQTDSPANDSRRRKWWRFGRR